MTAKLILGTEIKEGILKEIKEQVQEIKAKHGVVPGLVTILVGENPASISYVTLKIKTAHELGFKEIQDNQPDDLSEKALLALIDKYNKDDSIHGILVQLPLPKHIDEKKVLNAIDPDKDVDGFHPVNVGRLMIGGSEVKFPPCTPAGIQELIVRSGVQTNGAEVVVVGRSNIVGKPIANMMLQKGPGANATVTVVHTAHQGSGRPLQAGRHPDRGRRRSRSGQARVDQAGRLRDRRGRQPGRRKGQRENGQEGGHPERRRGLRRRQGDRRLDHPGPRRRRVR